jgi:anti-anti-sigma factor
MNLRVSTYDTGPLATVVVEGELDLSTSGRLEDAVRHCLVAEKRLLIDLDCTRVSFLASAGADAVLAAAECCELEGVVLRFSFSPQARRVLDLLGLWWLGVIDDGYAVDRVLEDTAQPPVFPA